MAKNDFKAFATDRNANVMSQEEWEALPALLSGFTAGKASSAQVNKAIRQASFIAAALAQYTANKSGLDVLDDGDLHGFISKMGTAFGKDFQALDATLTALAGLETGANKLPYFTGNDTAAQTDLTSVGRDIIGKKTIADILTYLGLGELSLAGTASGVIGLNGYVTIPLIISGSRRTLIIQWGQARFGGSGGEDAGYLNDFPFAFPSACYGMIVSHVGHTPSGAGILSASAITSNQFRGFSSIATAANAVLGRYIAIGV